MATKLGSFLRKLRIENGEILRTMAERLGVSSAFLSAVENGKKNMPESWYEKLNQMYSLSREQNEQLRTAALISRESVELRIRETSETNRDLAVLLARRFESLDEETSQKIMDILKATNEED